MEEQPQHTSDERERMIKTDRGQRIYVVRVDGESVTEIDPRQGDFIVYDKEGRVVAQKSNSDFASANSKKQRHRMINCYLEGLVAGSRENPFATGFEGYDSVGMLLSYENFNMTAGAFRFSSQRPTHLQSP